MLANFFIGLTLFDLWPAILAKALPLILQEKTKPMQALKQQAFLNVLELYMQDKALHPLKKMFAGAVDER